MRMRIKPMVKDFIYPVYKTAGAAAFDIFLQQDLTLIPTEPVTIKLGFAASSPHMRGCFWWPFTDLNSGQNDYESSTLTD